MTMLKIERFSANLSTRKMRLKSVILALNKAPGRRPHVKQNVSYTMAYVAAVCPFNSAAVIARSLH